MNETQIKWDDFKTKLAERVSESRAKNEKLALLIISYPSLSTYNYKLGFSGGEKIIGAIMNRLQTILKLPNIVTRISPEKIAVITHRISIPSLLSINIKRLIEELEKPLMIDDDVISITPSLGISLYPDHGSTPEALASEAELSLRLSTGNQEPFHIPSSPVSDHQVTFLEMQNEMQSAIADEDLKLHYQPKIHLNTLTPAGAEALMRWHLPNGESIRPDHFIPIAESSGFIFTLTEWALSTAIRETSEINWNSSRLSVAVNLSANTIYNKSLFDIIGTSLEIWGLGADQLILEVTESSLLKDPATSFENLAKIRNTGVKISIDDFGAGFSSLSYFKNIPADEIKIDQSFIKGMHQNPADEKIVALIIDLAHKFNLSVVAEGIENEQALTKLRDMNCDMAQGFHIARPMDFPSYQQWLNNNVRSSPKN